jgi:hypothetical protein
MTSTNQIAEALVTTTTTDPILTEIRIDTDLVLALDEVQQRAAIDPAKVAEYAELYRDGHDLGPLVLFRAEDEHAVELYLADGFHRRLAALEAKLVQLPAKIYPGSVRDAILFATQCNKHGMPLSNADKRRRVMTLLQDPEWRGWSDNHIAQHCGVAHSFVHKLRREVSLVLETSDDAEYVQTSRTYNDRYGHTRTMDTSKIGQKAPAPPHDQEPEKAKGAFSADAPASMPTSNGPNVAVYDGIVVPASIAERQVEVEPEGLERCVGAGQANGTGSAESPEIPAHASVTAVEDAASGEAPETLPIAAQESPLVGSRGATIPGSVQWCRHTIESLRHYRTSKRMASRYFAHTVRELTEYEAWNVVPQGQPYGSLGALLVEMDGPHYRSHQLESALEDATATLHYVQAVVAAITPAERDAAGFDAVRDLCAHILALWASQEPSTPAAPAEPEPDTPPAPVASASMGDGRDVETVAESEPLPAPPTLSPIETHLLAHLKAIAPEGCTGKQGAEAIDKLYTSTTRAWSNLVAKGYARKEEHKGGALYYACKPTARASDAPTETVSVPAVPA